MNHYIHINGEGERFCFVGVPEQADDYWMMESDLFYWESPSDYGKISIPGKWQILSKASLLTEEQKEEIVKSVGISFKIGFRVKGLFIPVKEDKMTLASLLSSLGITEDCLILKEI